MRAWIGWSFAAAWAVAALVAVTAALASCRMRGEPSETPMRPAQTASAPSSVADPGPVQPPMPVPDVDAEQEPELPPRMPPLDREPAIGVLLGRGARLRIQLLQQHVGPGGMTLPPGALDIEAVGGALRVAGRPLGMQARLQPQQPGAPAFAFAATPPTGQPRQLRLLGAPELVVDRGQVLLIERVGLETYLAGVLPVEMNRNYPREALAAQAVAARSYAAARWCARWHLPWQLHWHHTVDMAYGGAIDGGPTVRAALAQTRGEVLTLGTVPIPAYFHACSGGRTEAFVNVWPTRRAPDGQSLVAAMPSVEDPAAQGGSAGLGMLQTHWRWKVDLPLSLVGTRLQAWSRERHRERPPFGLVLGVGVERRTPDSGRVAAVRIRHRSGGREREDVIPAVDFRLAVGPGELRSTWWDRCVVAAGKGGVLVIEGRGYGHGVGLSQVSAWQLAKQGEAHAAILARFYPGAPVTRLWP